MSNAGRLSALLVLLAGLSGCVQSYATPYADGPDGGAFPGDPCNGVPEELCAR